MASPPTDHTQQGDPLTEVLRHKDVWRGYTQQQETQKTLDTGHTRLNKALVHNGWPAGGLIELCPTGLHTCGEWSLLTPAIKALMEQSSKYVVLLNPPATPFAPGLLQAGINLDQLLIISPKNKQEFIFCFIELARAQECAMVLSWPPKQALNYTELRKCQLATTNSSGFFFLIRNQLTLQQSSPARLKIKVALKDNDLQLDIIKQKGQLKHSGATLPQAIHWRTYRTHNQLELSVIQNQHNIRSVSINKNTLIKHASSQ